jgi:hypothetical protein
MQLQHRPTPALDGATVATVHMAPERPGDHRTDRRRHDNPAEVDRREVRAMPARLSRTVKMSVSLNHMRAVARRVRRRAIHSAYQ